MITKLELEKLYEKIQIIGEAKYDGYGSIDSVELLDDGDFNVTFRQRSNCSCCSDEIDYITVLFDETQLNMDEVVKQHQEEKRLKEEARVERLKEQKNKEAKAKEVRELAEFKRLQNKFNK